MKVNTGLRGRGEGQFNTLAQKGTNLKQKSSTQRRVIVVGNGTDMSKLPQLNGWAKRKTITQKTMLALIDVARAKGAIDREWQYWNTFYCLSETKSSEGRLYGKYCKNKFCALCLGIRKADILNRYLPVLKKWEDAYFVTLTIKSVSNERLPLIINKMIQGFERIIDKYRKRNQRGKGQKLYGIKSLECNFNPKMKTYNPHFHIIVPSREIADTLRYEWHKLWKETNGTKWTDIAGQHKRKIKDMEKHLVECVKYGTKIFTEPDVMNKTKLPKNNFIYVSAFDNIIAAMNGHRLFDRFGFNLPNNKKSATFSSIANYDKWSFDLKLSDWINSETEEALTGHILPTDLNAILSDNMDMEKL